MRQASKAHLSTVFHMPKVTAAASKLTVWATLPVCRDFPRALCYTPGPSRLSLPPLPGQLSQNVDSAHAEVRIAWVRLSVHRLESVQGGYGPDRRRALRSVSFLARFARDFSRSVGP